MECKHCKTDLDGGDIFIFFLYKYNDKKEALESAKKYGWSETNKLRFSSAVIVQPVDGPQYIVCPVCKGVL
jgi:hypothetical protein